MTGLVLTYQAAVHLAILIRFAPVMGLIVFALGLRAMLDGRLMLGGH